MAYRRVCESISTLEGSYSEYILYGIRHNAVIIITLIKRETNSKIYTLHKKRNIFKRSIIRYIDRPQCVTEPLLSLIITIIILYILYYHFFYQVRVSNKRLVTCIHILKEQLVKNEEVIKKREILREILYDRKNILSFITQF